MPASLTCPPEPWTPSESETKSLSKIHAMEKKFSGGIQGRMGWVERMGLRRRQLSILLSSPSTVTVPAYLYIYIYTCIHTCDPDRHALARGVCTYIFLGLGPQQRISNSTIQAKRKTSHAPVHSNTHGSEHEEDAQEDTSPPGRGARAS